MKKVVLFIKKYSKLLLYLGIALLVAGTIAGIITAKFSSGYLLLIILGIICIAGSLINVAEKFLNNRATQAGTNALIATVSVLVIIALINFLAVRYSYRVDLTENKILSLSPQSQEIVNALPKKLKVWIFTREANDFDRELLENYSRYSNNFSFEFVDPEINIELAQKFQIKSLGEVYLEYGEKRNLVTTLGLGQTLSEITLTNAIETIKKEKFTYIYILQGHGELPLDETEEGLSQAINNLKAKGNIIESLNLATSPNIPENTNLIIIPGPQKQLFPGEIEALKKYLDAGNSLMLMLDPDTNSGLEPLLNDWGITLDNRLLIDASGIGNAIGLGPATIIITEYGDHPITKDFANNISVYPISRRIEVKPTPTTEVFKLLITNPQTWAESDLTEQEVSFNQDSDISGPLDLGVALTKRNEQDSNQISRLIVIGNSGFASNSWLGQQFNKDFFINSVNWLTKNDDSTLSISPKEPKNRRINLSPIQSLIITLMAVVIMPFLALTTAGIIWWKRR